MVHHAKVDRWLAALIGGAALLEVAAGAVVLAAGLGAGAPDPQTSLTVGPILVGGGGLLGLALWGCYETRYEVTSSDLIVCFGPFRTTLPLDTIVEVFPTHNPLSAPAPSLDRLRINYRRKSGGRWFALISPKDKEGFVRNLADAAPQLRNIGNGPLRLKADVTA
jgi:hypothetical protein